MSRSGHWQRKYINWVNTMNGRRTTKFNCSLLGGNFTHIIMIQKKNSHSAQRKLRLSFNNSVTAEWCNIAWLGSLMKQRHTLLLFMCRSQISDVKWKA